MSTTLRRRASGLFVPGGGGSSDAAYVAAMTALSPWGWWRGITDITRLVDDGSLGEPWGINKIGFHAAAIGDGAFSANPDTTAYIARRGLPSFLVGDVAQAYHFRVSIPAGNYSGCILSVGTGLDGMEVGIGGTTMDNTGRQLIMVNPGVAWLPTGLTFPTGDSYVTLSRATGGGWTAMVNALTPFTTTYTHHPTLRMTIGGDGDGTTRFLSSASIKVSDMAIFDHTVNSTRHAAYYNGGAGDRSAIATDTPKIWLKMEDAGPYSDVSGNYFLDSSGNNRFMAAAGSAPPLVPGKVNKAFSFADGLAGLKGIATISQPTTVTYKTWVWIGANPAASTTLLCVTGWAGVAVGPTSQMWLDTAGKINFSTFNGSGVTITDATALPTNAWTFVACSVGAAGMKIRRAKTTVASDARTAAQSLSSGSYAAIREPGDLNTINGTPPVLLAEPAIWMSQLANADTDSLVDAAA